MDRHGRQLLRILLNAYYGNNANAMCRFLNDEEAEQIKALDINSADFSYAFRTPEEWLEKIHYSWLAPAFSRYPQALRPALAASLPSQQSSCVRQLLALEKVPPPALPAKRYLQRLLYNALDLKEVMPEELLPNSPFRALCDWDKKRLTGLIDLLSMYDLAEKLKHIVDRKRLRDIYACLNKERLEYLRICMHAKEKVTSTELKLDAWKGDPKELDYLLHRRGLIRFGMALSGESQDVLWYILHRLDTGRSAIIEKCLGIAQPKPVIDALAQQMHSVIEFLDTKGSRE
jgi:hypothetical protein